MVSSFLLQSTLRQYVQYNRRPLAELRLIQSFIQCRSVTVTSSINSSDDKNNTNNRKKIFSRKIKQLQRDGAARAHRKSLSNQNNDDQGSKTIAATEYVDYDYLYKEIGTRLVDRLDDIKKEEGFPLALDIGSGPGYLHRIISSDDALGGAGGGIGGVRKLVELDSSHEMLHRDDDIPVEESVSQRCGSYKLAADEEGELPFPNNTFDLVISSTSLHWTNDIESLLKEVKRVLKPDGCFMCAIIGGSTLSELRSSFVLAEMEQDGGVSPHVGPFIDFADVGSLLTNAGFTLPTIDMDTINLSYPNAMVLMEHLQRMGESNANIGKRERVSLDTFLSTAAIYQEFFSIDGALEEGVDEVKATVQVIYAIGWSPHASQQKPDRRGSASRKIGNSDITS